MSRASVTRIRRALNAHSVSAGEAHAIEMLGEPALDFILAELDSGLPETRPNRRARAQMNALTLLVQLTRLGCIHRTVDFLTAAMRLTTSDDKNVRSRATALMVWALHRMRVIPQAREGMTESFDQVVARVRVAVRRLVDQEIDDLAREHIASFEREFPMNTAMH